MIESIKNKKYKMRYCSLAKLNKLGFKYNEDNEKYSYRFPVYKYLKTPNLIGVITTDIKGNITLDVEDKNGGTYPPFYYIRYGNYDEMLNIINTNILNVFKKMKIEEKKNGKTKTSIIKNNSNKRVH